MFAQGSTDYNPDSLISVYLYGYASPEGPQALNERLHLLRLEAIETLLLEKYNILPGNTEFDPRVYNWNVLADGISRNKPFYAPAVLPVIEDSTLSDSRKISLLRNAGSRVWQDMTENYFPSMRAAGVSFVFAPAETDLAGENAETEVILTDTIENNIAREVPADMSETASVGERKPLYLGLSTNMLYDVAALPNIGFEAYLGKNLSIKANWMYGWWSRNRNHRYWRAYGGDLGLRWYFGSAAKSKPLTGHHLGVYVQVLTYDFEFGGKGQMAGIPGGDIFNRASGAYGIEYGYSLPIARHLNIDFNIGVGYLGGRYYEYKPIDDHYVWQATKSRHYFGPTKLEVSLVWLFGRGNVNIGKGGKK